MADVTLTPAQAAAATGWRAWIAALRPHQWFKNALVFVPLALAHGLLQAPLLATAGAAFALFCVVSSATYLLNDVSDLAADRAHPTKRFRPIAAGQIGVNAAVPVAVGMLIAGMAAAAALSRPYFGALSAYLALTLLYSMRLKREALADVLTIGGLFALRIVAGMAVIGQPISMWLTSFAMVLFTSLALAKRHAELVRATAAVPGRGYAPSDAPLTAAAGMATGMASIVVMLLYMALEAARTGLYHDLSPLFLIPVALASWLARVWVKAHRGVLHDDPVIFALKDPASWGHAVVVAALWFMAV
jgi:4-hydroxybenzoate polyprenyltransferase